MYLNKNIIQNHVREGITRTSKNAQLGITLIALVITIILLLILAGVVLSLTLGENGILKTAERAAENYKEAQAREILELALISAEKEKYINSEYNENEWLDKYVEEQITNYTTIINGDIFIVDGWQFQVDRSVPKIIGSLGKSQQSDQIAIVTTINNSSDYTTVTIKLDIKYEGEIESIKIQGEEIDIPEKIDGVYTIEKQVSVNGNYNVIVKDKDGNYKIETIKVDQITEDLEIYTAQEMRQFRDGVNEGRTYVGKTVKLKADIDLQGNEENQWVPIGNYGENENLKFLGTFDGENHTISNLYINNNLGSQALFGRSDGTICNLKVNGEVNGNYKIIAALCANCSGGIIENCINNATVNNSATNQYLTAGIVANLVNGGKVSNCSNYGKISTSYRGSGGIVGRTGDSKCTIDSCKNYGEVYALDWAVGGIIGYTEGETLITNCYNEGNISTDRACAGGICGDQISSQVLNIQQCINKGKIEVNTYGAGGIVGNVDTITSITKCKNEGEILAGNGNAGGIIGSTGNASNEVYTSKVESCVNTGYIHATGKAGSPGTGGIIGSVQTGDNAVINNSYNTGKIASTSYSSGNIYHGVGGIVGVIYNTGTSKSKATISNCYNIGNITNSYSASYAGQIIGRDQNNNHSVTNCYYVSTASGKNTYGGTSVVSATLKTYASKLGTANWKNDDKNINQGYPVLIWE